MCKSAYLLKRNSSPSCDDGIIIIYLSITSFSTEAALKPYERESNLIQLSLNGNLCCVDERI